MVCPSLPATYDPDWSAEVGEKARLFDNRATVNADVYFVKWNQMQNAIIQPCGYLWWTNLGDTRT